MENGCVSRKVKVLSSEYVVPAAETPNHSIWLSNLDLAANRKCYTPVIYIYRGDGNNDGFFNTPILKSSLSKTLVPYYPYAGEYGYDDDGRLEIRCTGKGVFFVDAYCDCTIQEFGDFTPSPTIATLFLPKAIASAEPPCPLILVQVNRFKCGSVCLVTAVHHMMGDGPASLRFISTWAEIARGGDPAAVSAPFLDRSVLKARSPPCVEYEHKEYDFCKPVDRLDDAPPKPSTVRSFHLTKRQVGKLKAEGKGASTFSVVTSHAWRTACKARKLALDQPTRVFTSVDIRGRLAPPLPENFLGNAVLPAKVEAVVEEVVNGTIEEVGEKFEEAKRERLHDRYLRSQIDFLESRPRTERVRLGSGDIVAVNWINFPLYETDFGWGSPVYVHRATLPTCGMVYVMRNKTAGEGNLMVTVALEEEYIERYRTIFYEDLGCKDDGTTGDC